MSTAPHNAIIVGCDGQDGRYLAELLRKKGYQLILIGRDTMDITDPRAVRKLVAATAPCEIYLLAARHHSAESALEPDAALFASSLAVHATATVNFLDAVVLEAPQARVFFASSSHIYAANDDRIDENSLPAPANIYAITKYCGMQACRYYRETQGVYASCGILFNHESPLRPAHFLSRKVAIAAAQISAGRLDCLELGNLDGVVDWGFAPDYVDAMHRMLQLDQPADYIVATGMGHSVRDFVQVAFDVVGLDYRRFIRERPDILKKKVEARIGNPGRLQAATGWHPTTSFPDMVRSMVEQELACLGRM